MWSGVLSTAEDTQVLSSHRYPLTFLFDTGRGQPVLRSPGLARVNGHRVYWGPDVKDEPSSIALSRVVFSANGRLVDG